jgi:hypothetical protein
VVKEDKGVVIGDLKKQKTRILNQVPGRVQKVWDTEECS